MQGENTRKFWLLIDGLFEGTIAQWENCFGGLGDEATDDEAIGFIREWANDYYGLEVEVSTIDDLMSKFETERQKFTQSDNGILANIINALVELGAYPEPTPMMQKNGYSCLDMAKTYGPKWHEWKGWLECSCGADLRDLENGPPFKLEIGIEVQGVYDGVLFYRCPECGNENPRTGLEKEYEAWKSKQKAGK